MTNLKFKYDDRLWQAFQGAYGGPDNRPMFAECSVSCIPEWFSEEWSGDAVAVVDGDTLRGLCLTINCMTEEGHPVCYTKSIESSEFEWADVIRVWEKMPRSLTHEDLVGLYGFECSE